ncbi:extracellular solute-binding protein [Marinilactibacillus kalidii]|uniref:extracellular solute-binding protein n=1 Tax=Marinilactibacillus kalidii TaxID=2820274 RepID=UPI001ABEE67D|nr:extracellular solute-binding protein [Marinilactibacillus kalidii]
MLNKKYRSLLFLSVVGSLLIAGCGDGNGSNETEGDTMAEPDLDDDSLWVWGGVPPHSSIGSAEESPFHTGLAENLDLNLEWQFPTEGTDTEQAYNLMITQDVLPDLIWHNWMGEASRAIDEGIIRDLTDDLPEKAPNYWKFLQDNPEIDRAMRTDDGKYYMIGFYREEPFQTVFHGPMVRRDWLEEQNLAIPENIDEFTAVIENFYENYGTQFSILSNWRMNLGMAGSFGAHGSFEARFFLEDGEIKMAQTQPEWLDYMAWLNDLYERNLLDPDFVTMDDQALHTKAFQDEIGLTYMNSGTLLAFNNQAITEDTGADWIGIPYPKQANGEMAASIFVEDMYVTDGFAISTSIDEERLDNAYKFLDWVFTEEGYNYWNYGTEGETWEKVDGEVEFTDFIEEHDLGKDAALALYTGNLGYGLGEQAARFIELRLDEPTYDAMFEWSEGQEEAIAAKIPAAITMTAEERREDANLNNVMNTYVLEEAIKFVTGSRSMDEFDEFIKELNDIGLDRMLEIRNDAYQRYLSR